MKIVNAYLKIIATRISQYPDDELPEFLLVGRSNVGKSSFINTILNKRGLARTSSTPGKTQTLNFYLENREELKRVFMIVDFRIKPTEDDILMYQFLKYYDIPVTIIAGKADKVGGSKREHNLTVIRKAIDLAQGDDIIEFSSVSKKGRDEVLNKIESLVVETI